MKRTVIKRTVLVIDSKIEVRDAMLLALSLQGYAVQVSASRERALKIAHEYSPDAVLLDAQMLGLPLPEFLAQWRAAHPTTAVVLTSTSANLAAEARALDVRFHLTKPFEAAELAKVLKRCMKSARSAQ